MRAILALLLLTISANAVPPAGDYVVVLNDQESPRMVTRDHGIGPKKMWTNALHGFHATLNTNHLARLERDTRVQIIETNVVGHTCAQVLPTGVLRIGCTNNALWLASSTVPINCDVAVIDTGIDLTHSDLNVYANVTFVSGTTTGNDDYGHGSHVAGIIGAKNNTFGVVGVAPGCRLWAVKVLDSTGSGNLSSIISGVDYVTQHASEIEVANMSLGGQGSSASLRLAIQNSVARGVVYVVAAGNSAFDVYGGDGVMGTADDYFPASYPEVMTVSAMGDSDGIAGGLGSDLSGSFGTIKDDTIATFSNYSASVDSSNPVWSPGAAIDVAAPGVNIYSTYKNGGYYTMSGTSMASPHVAGAVALYIAQFGRATTSAGVWAIRQAIINAAEPQTAWGRNPTNPFPYDHNPEGLVDVRTMLPPVVKYPNLVVTSPSAGMQGKTTIPINFAGSAIDSVDGDISANIYWRSSLDGLLGTGGLLTTNLHAGTHTISVVVTNSQLAASRYGIQNIVIAAGATTPPTLTIIAPVGVYADTDLIPFVGTAIDGIDGDISYKIQWSSTLDGIIGYGASFSNRLSAGWHAINIQAANSSGSVGMAGTTLHVTGTTPPPPVNYPPVVSITQPTENASFPQGSTVTFVGAASDAEDGSLTSVIRWADNVFGGLGVGASVSTNGLAIGPHTVTASVSDSSGAIATATRHVSITSTNVPNVPPTVTITAPASGTAITVGSALTFQGTGTDPEDGAITPTWNSSLDGSMATSTSFAYTLATVGTHTITARAVDTEGAEGSASITVIVNAVAPPPVTNTAPVVTITQPASNVTIPYGQSQTFICTAMDAQEGAMTNSVVWNDSLTGYIGSGGTVTMTTPTVGTHVVTAKVTDAGGLTGSASRTVIVQAPVYPLVVTVTASPTTVVNKQKVLLSTTVTANALPVSGITVNFSVKGASGKVSTRTLTTGAAGTASYYFQVNKGQLGAGVATVTVNASKAGYTSGVGSTTFTVR